MTSIDRTRSSSTLPALRILRVALLLLAAIAALVIALVPGRAQQAAPPEPPATLFQNVRVFDGKSSNLSPPSSVLVRGNKIERISTSPITPEANTRVIDGGGRVLMPGLIDDHWHTMFVRPTPPMLMTSDPGYIYLLAGVEAEATLLRGFTTVRDLGGPSFSLKRAIDEGLVPGPRIYPSGAMITVTSGHGD